MGHCCYFENLVHFCPSQIQTWQVLWFTVYVHIMETGFCPCNKVFFMITMHVTALYSAICSDQWWSSVHKQYERMMMVPVNPLACDDANTILNIEFIHRRGLTPFLSFGNCCFLNQQRRVVCFCLHKREFTSSMKQKKSCHGFWKR